MAFDHEKLDVYPVAIEFIGNADTIIENFPPGRGYLADQLRRAALSIVLNLGEGAARFSPGDKAVFYTRARASASECSAALDVAARFRIVDRITVSQNKELLARISMMLLNLIKSKKPAPAPAPAPGS